jgi:hypothetical protein
MSTAIVLERSDGSWQTRSFGEEAKDGAAYLFPRRVLFLKQEQVLIAISANEIRLFGNHFAQSAFAKISTF